MPSSIGERLYSARTEYPLPTEQGTGDFIYSYGRDDEYSQHAQKFLDRVYPRHSKERVGSLMQVIDDLHRQVTSGGVEKIREVVLVGHANAHELLLPVVPDPPAGLGSVNAGSLHALQAAFRTGGDAGLQGFDDRRKQVVARMSRSSFVTIRACRFGLSSAGMFALYSFFGGLANVYAPTTYMYFTMRPIGPHGRFRNEADVVEHMASQRIVRRQQRTPNRQAALVTMLAEPGHASDFVTVAEADLSHETPETAQYLAQVAELAKGTVPGGVRAALENELGVVLEAQPTLSLQKSETMQIVNGAGDLGITQWRILEELSPELDALEPQLGFKPSKVLRLECSINDFRPTRAGAMASLEVFARVVEQVDTQDKQSGARPARGRSHVHIQLFLTESDNDRFEGMLGELASHQVPNPNPDHVAAVAGLEDALGRLAQGTDTAAAALLRDVVNTHTSTWIPEQDLTVEELRPIPERLQRQGVRRAWQVEVGELYGVEKIEREEDTGRRTVALRLRKGFGSRAERDSHRERVANDVSWGTNPDVPGVELMSYLDGLSADELIALIDYLDGIHDVRRTEVGPVWRHAAAALNAKKDKAWDQAIRAAGVGDPLFPIGVRYYEIYDFDSKIGALLELSNTSYPFASRTHWTEVRESNPPSSPPVADLFSEQPLPTPPAYLTVAREPAPSASVTTDREPTTQAEIDMHATLSTKRQSEYHPPVVPAGQDCEKFRRAAKDFFALSTLPESELDAAIAALAPLDSIEDPTLAEVWELGKNARDLFDVMMEKTGGSQEKFVVKLIERFPRLAMGAQVTPRLVQAVRLYSFGNVMFSLLGWMFTRLLGDLAAKQASDSAQGAQAAIRAYARRLRAFAREHPTDFPETIPFSIAAPAGSDPELYAVRMFLIGIGASDGVTFPIPHPTMLLAGYDKGRRLVEEVVARELQWAAYSMNRQLRAAGFTECEVSALQEAGWLSPPRVRAAVMMQTARALDKAASEMLKRREED